MGDTGLWDDKFIPYFERLADFIRAHDSVPAIQLGHSGRKARRFRPWEGGAPLSEAPEGCDDWDDWELVAPSALPGGRNDPEPRALTNAEVKALVGMWGDAARRVDEAGFDVLEIHAAHGYLIHQFLSPHANVRNDEYGGSEENRFRFATEIVEAVRANWRIENRSLCGCPWKTMPVGVRRKASAWQDVSGRWGLMSSIAVPAV